MTQKYENFILSLESLCKQEKVQLAVDGYGMIQIWDLKEGDDPIYGGHAIDKTNQDKTVDP